ncbi:phage/plasmid primase P4 [Mesorhizobium tianshanense]|nr:phage/plasmid primase P4 [Mesorhizobium tianshanense]
MDVKDESRIHAVAELDTVKEHTDEALALEFARRHAMRTRYVDGWSRWMLFDGVVWAPDEILTVYNYARALCRDDAASAPPRDGGRILSAKTVAAVVALARSDSALAAVVDQWDEDPMALNCDGEVVQLDADGCSRRVIPGDYMTKSTAVGPGDGCPLWLEFLALVTGDDGELIDYLQRVCGYCLTGLTVEHALFFLWGPGGNGKSTFIETISGVMGDYAKTAGIDTFTASASDRHPTDLAALQGARLVTSIETAKGRSWDETRIKTLTGGDRISARYMRQDFFEYTPQFKLMIAGNNKPALTNVDDAFRRRFHMIPFIVRIPDDKRILGFSDRLRDEWPGILAWMIEGAGHWRRLGLSPPPAVLAATQEYLDGEDTIGAWLDECTERVADGFESRQRLFASWKEFALRTGENPGTQKQLVGALAGRAGIYPHKREGIRGYLGIRITWD